MLIRQAQPADAATIQSILTEATHWLEQSGRPPLWRTGELELPRIAADIANGIVFLAEIDHQPAATLMFQLEDEAFWPDVPPAQAGYVHRIAIRRAHAGTGLSADILHWAADSTRSLNRRFLRLDCEASRPQLKAIYQRFGFRHVDDRQVSIYRVSRYEYDVTKNHPKCT
jgi:GNAT superfamily N-acetyltransferase